jgi:hypothetical protein
MCERRHSEEECRGSPAEPRPGPHRESKHSRYRLPDVMTRLPQPHRATARIAHSRPLFPSCAPRRKGRFTRPGPGVAALAAAASESCTRDAAASSGPRAGAGRSIKLAMVYMKLPLLLRHSGYARKRYDDYARRPICRTNWFLATMASRAAACPVFPLSKQLPDPRLCSGASLSASPHPTSPLRGFGRSDI